MSAKKAVREVQLPEGLDIPEMSKEELDKKVVEYRQKQEERFSKRLEDRVERFAQKLMDKGSQDREVMVRQILIDNLKSEIGSRREAIKQLRNEVKELRPKRRRSPKQVA